jgi:sec-independent protein translocase protein TatB
MDLRDLNPRTFVQKHLLDDVEPIIADVKSEITDVQRTVNASTTDAGPRPTGGEGRQRGRSRRGAALGNGSRRILTPYDAEAT